MRTEQTMNTEFSTRPDNLIKDKTPPEQEKGGAIE
jgi:hypothetical protein